MKANTILQIVKIDPDLIEEIKPAWHRLPQTDHADGKYRLRKYSHVAVDIKDKVRLTDLDVQQFTQSSKYNKHQGGMVRDFEEVEEGRVGFTEAARLLPLSFFIGSFLFFSGGVEI